LTFVQLRQILLNVICPIFNLQHYSSSVSLDERAMVIACTESISSTAKEELLLAPSTSQRDLSSYSKNANMKQLSMHENATGSINYSSKPIEDVEKQPVHLVELKFESTNQSPPEKFEENNSKEEKAIHSQSEPNSNHKAVLNTTDSPITKTEASTETPRTKFASRGRRNSIKKLQASPSFNKNILRNEQESFLWSIKIRDINGVKEWLELDGGNVNTIFNTFQQRTALHYAAESGHAEAVRYLLFKGADINKSDAFGNTPLLLAARNGHIATMTYLLKEGATKDTRGNDGLSVIEVANGNPAILAILNSITKERKSI